MNANPLWTERHLSPKYTPATALGLVWAAEIAANLTGNWLVKGLLPSTGLAALYGHPGTAKTFLAMDMGLCIASGWDWFGRKVQQGLVIYLAAEGERGVRNRLVAWRTRHCVDSALPFALIPTPIDLHDGGADVEALMAEIKAAAAFVNLPPRLIVVDTLSKTFGAGSENTDDMARYIANCQRVASRFGCCVLLLHHRPKDAETTEMRGHSSLKGGLDAVLLIEGQTDRTVRVMKQKDGEIAEPFSFRLEQVELGQDEDGDPVTSCVVVEIPNPGGAANRRGPNLSDGQKLVMRALQSALADSGEYPPSEMPADIAPPGLGFKVAPVRIWRERAEALMAADMTADSFARVFRRHRDRLQSLGLIEVWGDFAWPKP